MELLIQNGVKCRDPRLDRRRRYRLPSLGRKILHPVATGHLGLHLLSCWLWVVSFRWPPAYLDVRREEEPVLSLLVVNQ